MRISGSLFECAECYAAINRFLHTKELKNEPEISIETEWETIDLTMSKDDYSCLMKIWRGNFSEKIHYKSPLSTNQEQSSEDERINQEKLSFDGSIKKQKDLSTDQISEKIRLDFQIKKISLILFLDEYNLSVRRTTRNENSKFVCMQIETIQAQFQYFFDSSYHGKAQIQSFLLEDLRQTNLSNSNTHLLDRNVNVDRNAPMFIVTVQFKPRTQTNPIGIQHGK